MPSTLRAELGCLFGIATTAIMLTVEAPRLHDLSSPPIAAVLFVWIFGAMLWCVFGVVRHADALAELLGEPYGTVILTLSAISIEVAVIMAIMLTGEPNPTVARDTMFAVLMIVLNGFVGVVLLVGGWRHGLQVFNSEGARTFLSLIVPLAVFSMVLPDFTRSTADRSRSPFLMLFVAASTVLLYCVFLAVQTIRHSTLFMHPGEGDGAHHGHGPTRSVPYHAVLLVVSLVPIVLLSEELALLLDHGMTALGAPAALAGVLVATLVLAPEGLSAISSALENRLQRAVNLTLGSALATIGLTVPAVLLASLITGAKVELGLEFAELVMLLLTLFVTALTFSSQRTNVLHGAVHLVLLLAYLALIFDA